jgi:hypothetical protein
MEKGSSKLSIILQIYMSVLLTIIFIFLFVSQFDVTIEKKNPSTSTTVPDIPKIEVQTTDDGLAINVEDEKQKLLRAKKNRDELSQHCSIIATDCQRYFRTPGNNGGGNLSFIGYKLDDKYTTTENGLYSIKVNNEKSVTITAVGYETGKDNNGPVKVVCKVNPVVIQMDSEN